MKNVEATILLIFRAQDLGFTAQGSGFKARGLVDCRLRG